MGKRQLVTYEARLATGLSRRRIAQLCQSQEFRGAFQVPLGPNGRLYWRIPLDGFLEWVSARPLYFARATAYFRSKPR